MAFLPSFSKSNGQQKTPADRTRETVRSHGCASWHLLTKEAFYRPYLKDDGRESVDRVTAIPLCGWAISFQPDRNNLDQWLVGHALIRRTDGPPGAADVSRRLRISFPTRSEKAAASFGNEVPPKTSLLLLCNHSY